MKIEIERVDNGFIINHQGNGWAPMGKGNSRMVCTSKEEVVQRVADLLKHDSLPWPPQVAK